MIFRVSLLFICLSIQNLMANDCQNINTNRQGIYDASTDTCCVRGENGYIENPSFKILRKNIQDSKNEFFSWLSSEAKKLGVDTTSLTEADINDKLITDIDDYIASANASGGKERVKGIIKDAIKDFIIDRLKSVKFYVSLRDIAVSGGLSLLQELFVGDHSYTQMDQISMAKGYDKARLMAEFAAYNNEILCFKSMHGAAAFNLTKNAKRAYKRVSNNRDEVDNLIIPFYMPIEELKKVRPKIISYQSLACSQKVFDENPDIALVLEKHSEEYRSYFKECDQIGLYLRDKLNNCNPSNDEECLNMKLGFYPNMLDDVVGINYLNGLNVNSVPLGYLRDEKHFVPNFVSYMKSIFEPLLKELK